MGLLARGDNTDHNLSKSNHVMEIAGYANNKLELTKDMENTEPKRGSGKVAEEANEWNKEINLGHFDSEENTSQLPSSVPSS